MDYILEYREISSVTESNKNARIHSAEQIKQIKNSILEFGFTSPLIINGKNQLIAGHGRLEAVKQLNGAGATKLLKLPCVIVEGLTEAQERALAIADNRIPLNAGWDFDLLSDEVTELASLGVDIDLLGFNKYDIGSLLQNFQSTEAYQVAAADGIAEQAEQYDRITADKQGATEQSRSGGDFAGVMSNSELREFSAGTGVQLMRRIFIVSPEQFKFINSELAKISQDSTEALIRVIEFFKENNN